MATSNNKYLWIVTKNNGRRKGPTLRNQRNTQAKRQTPRNPKNRGKNKEQRRIGNLVTHRTCNPSQLESRSTRAYLTRAKKRQVSINFSEAAWHRITELVRWSLMVLPCPSVRHLLNSQPAMSVCLRKQQQATRLVRITVKALFR